MFSEVEVEGHDSYKQMLVESHLKYQNGEFYLQTHVEGLERLHFSFPQGKGN